MASSPMKKSRSSIPRLLARLVDALAGAERVCAEAVLDELLAVWCVAIAVGNTNDGSLLPAKLRGESANWGQWGQ